MDSAGTQNQKAVIKAQGNRSPEDPQFRRGGARSHPVLLSLPGHHPERTDTVTHFSGSCIWCQLPLLDGEWGVDPEEASRRTPAPPDLVSRLTYGGNGGDDLPQLQLVQDCGLASCIQANCKGEGHRDGSEGAP